MLSVASDAMVEEGIMDRYASEVVKARETNIRQLYCTARLISLQSRHVSTIYSPYILILLGISDTDAPSYCLFGHREEKISTPTTVCSRSIVHRLLISPAPKYRMFQRQDGIHLILGSLPLMTTLRVQLRSDRCSSHFLSTIFIEIQLFLLLIIMKTQRKMVKKKLKGQEYRRKNVEIRPVVFILCNKALKRKIGILKYIYLEILTLFFSSLQTISYACI